MNAKIFGEPARFNDAGNEVEVTAAQRSAEPARDKKFVARLTAASSDPSRFLDASDDTNGDHCRAFNVTRLAADNRHSERARGVLKSTVEPLHPADFALRRHDQRHQRRARNCRHRRKIAQWPRHCLPSHQFGPGIFREMNSLDQAIGFQDVKHAALPRFDERTIIASAKDDLRAH